jgi:DNA-binding PadR family transcriptional regulator
MADDFKVSTGDELVDEGTEQAEVSRLSQPENDIPGGVECEDVISVAPQKQGRARPPAPVYGLTGRQYQVLRILNTHGWCTPEMVRQIAKLHGIPWTADAGRVYQILRSLESSGHVVCMKVKSRTRTKAYAASERGLRYILADGDALLCDTNAIKDPASPYHFLGLNKIMLTFRSQFQTKFWLTDFEVRSDNSFIGADGFAKDYDSAAELILPSGTHVRFAVEYERYQQSTSRYLKLKSMLASEKRLQFVLFFYAELRLRTHLMNHLKALVGFVYYVEYDRFLKMGMETPAYYWNSGKLYQTTVNTVLQHGSQRLMQDYVPVHQLNLGPQW